MGIKSRGRGTAAAFGLLLVFAGLIGGAVLFVLSTRRHDDAVSSFARAPVGCTTTLDFTETGVFYVYEERGGEVDPPEGNCEPAADPREVFGFELSGSSGVIVPRRDSSISYDVDGFVGQSVDRFEIDTTGEYEIAVVGDEASTVAAIGRDPDDGVAELRQRAIVVVVAGVVLGVLLLILAGRRSKRAAEVSVPPGPGWGSGPTRTSDTWPPEAPRIDQVPVNPLEPDAPVETAAPLPARTPPASTPSPWAPPTTGAAPSGETPPRPPPPPPAVPPPTPTLPDTPGRPSGVSPAADEIDPDGGESVRGDASP
jgi:hypothetical protein